MSAIGSEVTELAVGLDRPMGVAITPAGTIYVSETGAGRIVRIAGGAAHTVIDGLPGPQGIAVYGNDLIVVDTVAKTVSRIDLATGTSAVIAANMPVGAPAGVRPKFLGAIGDMAGPMIPFADIAAAPDGSLYVSGDAEGSVLLLRPRPA